MISTKLTRAAATTAVAVALAGGSAIPAAAATDTVVRPPRTFAAVNPCTGEDHLVTIAQTGSLHTFELSDPDRLHVNDRLTGTLTTTDGFSGTISEAGVDNTASPDSDEETGAYGSVVFGIARNDSGLAFSVHGVFHVTVVDGESIVVVDNFRVDCLG